MTEIHQPLSPDFRFSDNGGFLAEIIQWRATKIGRGGAVDGRLGEETIRGGLTTILAITSHRHVSLGLQNFGSYPHRDSFVCDLFSNGHVV